MGFCTELGFWFNPEFTSENVGCTIISDNVFVMLLLEAIFRTFTSPHLAPAQAPLALALAEKGARAMRQWRWPWPRPRSWRDRFDCQEGR